jgi:hypothetical protein
VAAACGHSFCRSCVAEFIDSVDKVGSGSGCGRALNRTSRLCAHGSACSCGYRVCCGISTVRRAVCHKVSR